MIDESFIHEYRKNEEREKEEEEGQKVVVK